MTLSEILAFVLITSALTIVMFVRTLHETGWAAWFFRGVCIYFWLFNLSTIPDMRARLRKPRGDAARQR